LAAGEDEGMGTEASDHDAPKVDASYIARPVAVVVEENIRLRQAINDVSPHYLAN